MNLMPKGLFRNFPYIEGLAHLRGNTSHNGDVL